MADAGSSHGDGTFSLLRGGITELSVPANKAAHFKGALISRIVGGRSESGRHEANLKCVNEDGRPILPALTAGFEIPQKGGAVNLVMDIQITFPSHGLYEFSVTVDKIQMDSWAFEVKKPKEAKEK